MCRNRSKNLCVCDIFITNASEKKALSSSIKISIYSKKYLSYLKKFRKLDIRDGSEKINGKYMETTVRFENMQKNETSNKYFEDNCEFPRI